MCPVCIATRALVVAGATSAGGQTALVMKKLRAKTGALGVACAAVEALSRHLAGELGPQGIRVVCLQPDAIPEAVRIGPHSQEVFRLHAKRAGMTREQFDASLEARTLLRRLPTLAEVANAAAFLASDQASAMTGTVANLTCGSLVD